jgi:hypothetical protein
MILYIVNNYINTEWNKKQIISWIYMKIIRILHGWIFHSVIETHLVIYIIYQHHIELVMRYEFMKIIWEYVILLYEKFGDVVCWLWTIERCWVWWQWWRLIDQKNLDNLGTLTIEPQPTKVVLVVPNICPSKLLPYFFRIFGCNPPPAGSREKWQNVAKEDTENVPRNWRICRKFM